MSILPNCLVDSACPFSLNLAAFAELLSQPFSERILEFPNYTLREIFQ